MSSLPPAAAWRRWLPFRDPAGQIPSPARQFVGVFVVLVLALAFGWLVIPQYHPVYGFTRFLQIEPRFAARALPELQHEPVYQFRTPDGYDGQFYAQMALRPLLRDPALHAALDNPPLRGRRILLSWTAWLLGGGDAGRILALFPWINLVGWLVLAGLFCRLRPPTDAPGIAALAGLLFSFGVLCSVRFALTDLLALILLLAAMMALRAPHPRTAIAAFAAAGLARETSILASLPLALAPGSWSQRLGRLALVAIPLVAWMLYVHAQLPSEGASFRNFSWPLHGFLKKWSEVGLEIGQRPGSLWSWLTLATLFSLTVQPLILLRRESWRSPWAAFALGPAILLLLLGQLPFDGHPGAAARILLPLHLAFNLLAPSTRRGLIWLLLGNLSFGAGLMFFAAPHRDIDELAAAVHPSGRYLAWVDEGAFGREEGMGRTWTWCDGHARLIVRRFPIDPDAPPIRLGFYLVGAVDCTVTISHDETILWSGAVARTGTP